MTDKKNLSETEKMEKLYNLYTYAYDKFNKYIVKKDNNMQLIKEMNASLKNSPQNFKNSNPENITKYSLLLVEPFDKCSTKIMEVILLTMEEILRYDLVAPNILQKMVEKLIAYLHKYFQFNDIDLNVDSKILKICELIFINQNIFIHNENLK